MAAATLECTASEILVGMGQVTLAEAPARLRAILGSCVAVAVFHPRHQLAALAHVVLPAAMGRSGPPGKYADTALPHILAAMKAAGVGPAGLVAKIAGGANMFAHRGPLQIGDGNIQAVLAALSAHGIAVIGRDVGGNAGRRVTLCPASGELVVECAGKPPRVI
jgi:chemotaxis protein CheD